MSDFDPDAHLETDSAPAFDPDAHLDVPEQDAPPTVSRSGSKAPAGAFGDLGQAAVSGVNAGGFDLLGVPMDAATNASNLVKAGIGYTYSKLTGKPVPSALEADDPANVVGTSEWLKRKTREAGLAHTIDARNPSMGLVHTLGEAVGPVPLAAAVGKVVPVGPRVQPPAPSAQQVLDSAQLESPQSMGSAAAAPNVRNASPEIQQAIVRAAQETGGSVAPDVLTRHLQADALPVPIQLTEGQATQDPTLFSTEMNTRGKFPELAQRFNDQGKQLVANLDAFRERIGPDVFTTNPVEHGDALINAYTAKNEAAQANISAKYKALEDAAGGQLPVDGQALLNNVSGALHRKLLFDHAPKELSTLTHLADEGMNFEQFEALRTNLARVTRSSSDGNEIAAAGVIRDEMEKLPLASGAENLKPLADEARAAARAQFQALKADPAYAAAVDGKVSPDRFVQKFIVGGTRDGVATMRANLAEDPAALQTMSVSALDHLRQSAGIDPMGNGTFTQAGYNKAFVRGLGAKIPYLFDPETAGQLEHLGDVARYIQQAPPGNLVNRSNSTTSALADYGKGAVEGAVNVGFKGVPVGTWGRNVLERRAAARVVERSLAPGAGLERLPDVPKGKP